VVLWIRLWSGAANVIATDEDGTVLDAFSRRPKRDEVSGGCFTPERDLATIAAKRGARKEFQVRDLPGDGSFNERVEACYTAQERDQLLERLRAQMEQQFRRRAGAVEATLERLRRRQDQYEEFEQYKEYGDLVMSNLHAVSRGDRWLETANYYRDGERIRIPLDPQKSPSENAETYYRRFKKAKSGLSAIGEEVHNQLSVLAALRDERERLSTSDDPEVLASYVHQQKLHSRQTRGSTTPGLVFQSHGFTILVGRTAAENDELLRHHVRGNDYWLHSRDYPGAYVFIKARPGKSVPLETLLDAGNLALRYSKARNAGQGELYYTQVKHLRRVKEGRKGLVIPTQEKNLSVRMDEQRLERLHSIDAFGDS
jgi:predicted ribosome quality control (RQC) complex YloA/Tae2 family protein